MGKRITHAINKKPVEIDNENTILIIDSDDEETQSRPTSNSSSSFTISDAISIDLTEDDKPSSDDTVIKTSSQTPHKTETTPFLPILKRSLSTPTRKREISTSQSLKRTHELITSPKGQHCKSPNSNPPAKRTEQKISGSPVRSPNATVRKAASSTQETSVPPSPTNNKSSLKLPEKWNSQSSLESRTAQALLVKMVSSASTKKLSVPRSSLLKNTTSNSKRPSSSILKASSTPIRRPVSSPSISASLKRPIESPERPSLSATSVFASPQRLSSSNSLSNRSPALSSSPNERPRYPASPERRPHQTFDPFGSPERRPSQMFDAFASPPRPASTLDARRLKTSFSPHSVKPIEKKPSIFVDDDDESEDDLGFFISVVDSSRRRAVVNVSCFIFIV